MSYVSVQLKLVDIRKVVIDDSAHIRGYKALTLSDDHEGMCKCSGKDDNKYQTMLGVLRRWVTELKDNSIADKPEEVSTALFDYLARSKYCHSPRVVYRLWGGKSVAERNVDGHHRKLRIAYIPISQVQIMGG